MRQHIERSGKKWKNERAATYQPAKKLSGMQFGEIAYKPTDYVNYINYSILYHNYSLNVWHS